jgi:hypothetical protein
MIAGRREKALFMGFVFSEIGSHFAIVPMIL